MCGFTIITRLNMLRLLFRKSRQALLNQIIAARKHYLFSDTSIYARMFWAKRKSVNKK